MRRTSALFSYAILVCILLVATGSAVMAQREQVQNEPSRQPGGGDLTTLAQQLISQEHQNPTTAATVRDRYRDLMRIVYLALRSGKAVNDVLSREEGQRLESLINSGSLDSAVESVRSAIVKLDRLSFTSPSQQGSPAPAQPQERVAQQHASGSGMTASGDLSSQAQRLIAQERQDPTTAATVRDRYRDLILIVSKALKSSVPVNNVLSREEGQRLESLINSGSSNSAVDGVHAAIMKLYLISSSPARQNNPLGQAPYLDRMVAPTYPGPENNIVTPALFTVDVYRIVTAGGFGNILKLMNPVIDQERRRLYISGTKSSFFGVVDLDKDELIDTFDMGIPGGFLILDSSTGVVYLMDISNNRYFRIDFGTRKAVAIAQLPSTVSLPKRNVPRHYKGYDYHDTGYPFTVGYLQNENASYGIITIKDASGKPVTSIKHGPDALYFDIDQKTGKLYASNTGDGSISIFDLNSDNRKIKDIHVGIAIEKLILAPDSGGLFIANRLGGSALYHYNTETKSLVTIPNENTAGASGIGLWPTELVADDDTIYVLSHFAGRIDVVDAATNRVTKHIPLDLTYRPRTDALSSMAMDRTNKILYAAFPELGEIAAIDARAGKFMRTIKLDGVDITTSGPGGISLGVDDRVNRLFVYVPGQKTLHVYDSTSLKLLKSLDLDAGRGSRIVTPNPEKKVVYVGNTVVDVLTLEVKSQFPPGERVIAFYNPTNRVYIARLTPRGTMNNGESVLEYDNGNIRREWSLPSVLSIPSTFAFDFKNNVFYAGQFERAVIQAYDMKSRP